MVRRRTPPTSRGMLRLAIPCLAAPFAWGRASLGWWMVSNKKTSSSSSFSTDGLLAVLTFSV
jgi:hypothetical protein